jgi:HK97 family phage portal protein
MNFAKLPLVGRLFRSGYLNPAPWLVSWLTGGQISTSGVTVNANTALRSSTVFACVSAIASDVAKLPLEIFRENSDGTRQKADTHPVYPLLHSQPNPLMTAFDLRSVMTAHCLLTGNAYALIARDGRGAVKELWPLRPDRTLVYRVNERALEYWVGWLPQDGRPMQYQWYSQDDILHIPGLGYDGLVGYDVISFAKESIGNSLAVDQFGGAFFGNGAHPGGVLEHPGKLNDDGRKNLRESWNAMHQGAANQGKTAILEEGMKYNALTLAPEQSQFIETRQFSVADVCRWFRMLPRKVGDTTRAQGWSTVEASNTEYVQDALMPWLVRWEERIKMRLLGGPSSGLYAKHNVKELLRGDSAARSLFYKSAITDGWMTRNEVRFLEDMDPIKGLDEPLIPLNMATQKEKDAALEAVQNPSAPALPASDPNALAANPADGPNAETNAFPPKPSWPFGQVGLEYRMASIDEAFAPIFVNTSRWLVKREASAVRNAAKKPESFTIWADEFFTEERSVFRAGIGAIVDAYAEAMWAVRGEGPMPKIVLERAGEFTAEMAKRHCEACKTDLDGLSTDSVASRTDEWIEEIPASIAVIEMRNQREYLYPTNRSLENAKA